MIRSILDNDLYKFTMQQAVRKLYPEAVAEYRLTNRGQTFFPGDMARSVGRAVRDMEGLRLSGGQREWLASTCPYLTPEYLDFLAAYRFDPQEVTVTQDRGRLFVTVTGPWVRTILWEVPLMATISETFFDLTRSETLGREAVRERNQAKARYLAENGVAFVDFGTRRRFSAQNHKLLIRDILDLPGHSLTGTSNVHLAKEFDLSPIGTLAHEWIMFHGALAGYDSANAAAMAAWLKVYPDVLGIALTDTYTTEVFLQAFGKDLAEQHVGVRQDSGDPLAFIDKMINHYRDLGIDPADKTIVFSDGLDPGRAVTIHEACRGKIKDAYGIGTNLTNDIGPIPLNIVIKLFRCKSSAEATWRPVVKLSDDKGKHTGEREELGRCLDELGLA
ncbi:MAG TPA: nicotinate phosphoribosyltransferase [Desulfobacteraceae bacterium]|nr:nicotinate phosphoribosyltransferase [Desulfobacteraceae bacterium]